MILLSGASGKTGKTVIQHLLAQGARVRALAHRPEQQAGLKASGVEEVLCGDIRQKDFLWNATRGVDTIYHIPPNMSPDEAQIGRLMLQVARANNVRHFVYHSVLHPQARQMPHHWNKLKVESEIFTSGIDYSILQPTAYMQNIQAYWPRILADGIYSIPYAASARIGLVDLENVAEAAAKVILNPDYRNGIFELVGTPAYTQVEIADQIGSKIGKVVRVEELSRTDWEAQARKNEMPEYAIRALLKMFLYYERYGMGGNPAAIRAILGHPPTSYDQYLDRLLA